MISLAASFRKLGLRAGMTSLLIVIVSSIFWYSNASDFSVIGYLRHQTQEPSSVSVGPRKFGPFYRGCDSNALLANVASARLRPDRASRHINTEDLGEHVLYQEFKPSFDFDTCPPLHIFNSDEACDLLSAYGGLILSGDSFTRHVMNALFIILSGRNDGAVRDDKTGCRGEKTFIDLAVHCRLLVHMSSEEVPEMCGGNVFIRLDEIHTLREESLNTAIWHDLLAAAPPTAKSPIFFSSHGIHLGLNSDIILSAYIRPLLNRYRNILPKPVMLWGSIHYPPANKPVQWREEQGPVPTKKFNDDIGRALEEFPGSIIGANATMKQLDYYSMSNGAESADGGHYAYQVNLEKAQILLNLLDVVWEEARLGGGLLDTGVAS